MALPTRDKAAMQDKVRDVVRIALANGALVESGRLVPWPQRVCRVLVWAAGRKGGNGPVGTCESLKVLGTTVAQPMRKTLNMVRDGLPMEAQFDCAYFMLQLLCGCRQLGVAIHLPTRAC